MSFLTKKLHFIIIALCISNQIMAQGGSNWNEYNRDGFTFQLPLEPLIIDTLETVLFGCEVDTLLSLQVHLFKDARFNPDEPVFLEALNKEENDTLRAIASIFLLATNSELTELVQITTNEVKGISLGIKYLTLASNEPYYTFVRYYLYEGRFMSFTVTSAESDLERGVEFKNVFFNSINIIQ